MANGNGIAGKLDSHAIRLAIYLASIIFTAAVIITQARIEAANQAEKIQGLKHDVAVLTETVNGLMQGWTAMKTSFDLRVEQAADKHRAYDAELLDHEKRMQQVEFRAGISKYRANGMSN